ncbi:DNA-binding transcriptional regulator, GntR family [Monaibacterium marinum]|uniref:DNA-binding transcriptional regulator, GntR family n=1 Tax=Pontivivens marinum TaxID=1690039 RepID=A0A2C9CUQ4_9RHOB|nr:GntR family transcriptional regulator [Monaibacterium marinum]SOH94940.1 DNA-binding transcriptional regulator, GntR family [Monaibacterium marinum]
MARTNTRFVEAFNEILTLCEETGIGGAMPSENALAAQFDVSRTVVRGVLARLFDEGIISGTGREKLIQRLPTPADQMQGPPVLLTIEELEGKFLDWVLRMDVPPGTVLNVAQLAKEFSVATHTLQEFFSSLSRFSIVARRPRGGWELNGFTPDYAVELSDFRTVLELNSVRHLVELPPQHPIWAKLDKLEADHRELLQRIDTDYHDFSVLDEAFHAAINGVVTNRFVKEFQNIISLVFHYHFQWNKSDERTRNEAAIHEHLAYLDGLRSGDMTRAVDAARAHLMTSKQTLLNSLRVNSHTG